MGLVVFPPEADFAALNLFGSSLLSLIGTSFFSSFDGSFREPINLAGARLSGAFLTGFSSSFLVGAAFRDGAAGFSGALGSAGANDGGRATICGLGASATPSP